jgi:hypothetical protein
MDARIASIVPTTIRVKIARIGDHRVRDDAARPGRRRVTGRAPQFSTQ